MIHGQDPTLAENGRIHTILADSDGRQVYTHGVAVAPEGLAEQQALDAIQDIYAAVVSGDEEWTYDHLIDTLKARGFDHLPAGVWVE